MDAVGKIEQMSRARCRREFEKRFTDRHMAQDYVRAIAQPVIHSSSSLELLPAIARSPIVLNGVWLLLAGRLSLRATGLLAGPHRDV